MSKSPDERNIAPAEPRDPINALFSGNTVQGVQGVEIKHRNPFEEKVRVWKDVALFVVALFVSVITAIGSAWIVISPNQNFPPETKELAKTILILILGGFVGYLTGKSGK